MQAEYANIIVDISHEKLDRVFQYRVPIQYREQLKEGMEVCIPFGRGNRPTKGYVIELTDTPLYPEDKIKEITGIAKKSVAMEGQMIQFAAKIKQYCGSTMIQALKTVLPVKVQIKEQQQKEVHLLLTEAEIPVWKETYRKKHHLAKLRLLEALEKNSVQDYGKLKQDLTISPSTIAAMEKEKVLRIEVTRQYRNPVTVKEHVQPDIQLNEEQRQAVNRVISDYDAGIRQTYLLHGVTGSGKTEVYMELISYALRQNKQVIMLIPEIALTYQTVERFVARFGDRVSVMNSKLSQGERYDQFERAKRGETDVMIGPRSALFAPFERLGFIIVDEEHESSYKSETTPRYHAVEAARWRAQIAGASVVLGSATPSVISYNRALSGEYVLMQLKKRVENRPLADVRIADMREELKQGNRSIFSRELYEDINNCLAKKEQIMLFLNRRGYAGFLSCRSCGNVVKCPHCDVSLSVHDSRSGSRLICHYCGYQTPAVKTCPSCGSGYIGAFRAGTQQIEALIKKEFQEARVLRMDFDTTRKKGEYEQILSAFSAHKADILIGTQMIVKGHDFPEVTLVGVLAADLSLGSSDYKASERTFQLLTQAAGRAGRGNKPGKVVIQTYQPMHYSIQAAAAQDYEAFYREEMGYRTLMGYPPAWSIETVYISGEDYEVVNRAAAFLAETATQEMSVQCGQIIGPAPDMIAKLNDRYRMVLYFKHRDLQILLKLREKLEQLVSETGIFEHISIQFDYEK